MLLAQVGCVFVGFVLFLYISEVWGQANSVCALKGSSVDLPCSAKHPASNMKWFTVSNDSKDVLTKISADRNVRYNMSEESNFTLTIEELRESDENIYCCRESTDNPELCRSSGTTLQVADLQVKVLPTTEEQTVTLMCNTSCPLTENPATFVWYKNREFLYEDWSPWYQELVSSEEAATYSCAVKGYEDLRAPEVSVDFVTSACYTVTYAKGRMCSYQRKSGSKPCSITYPKEIHVQGTLEDTFFELSCESSCPTVDPETAYKWYLNRNSYINCNSQHITVWTYFPETISCAVYGLEDLHSEDVCSGKSGCLTYSYSSKRICALEGSSVNISRKHSTSDEIYIKSWYKKQRSSGDNTEKVNETAGRVEYHHKTNQHTLRINNLMKNDSAVYIFKTNWRESDLHGVLLVVTGLEVRMTPSAEVTEGQRVTLTCSTSCPLYDTTYIWYKNSQPLTLPGNRTKHLVLDPVSGQHAGNYSCAVETSYISSPEETLTVKALPALGKPIAVMNAVKLVLLLLILIAVFLLCLWMRKKNTVASTAELRDKVPSGQDQVYESIAFTHPAAPMEPAEQQEDAV